MTFKVLCDVHIAFKVVRFFETHGHEAIHVNDILDGYFTKDADLSEYADEHGYTLVSKDADFKNTHFVQNKPKKLLKISLGNIPTTKLISILEVSLDEIVENFQSEKCFIELGDGYMEIIK